MQKVLINRKPVIGPWGGGNNFVIAMFNNLADYGIIPILPEQLNNSYPDFILLQSPKPCNDLRFSINEALMIKQQNPATQIILRVNECDARKNTVGVDELWLKASMYVDKTIFVSEWMKNYFLDKEWACKNNYVVYNGVDLDHFKPIKKQNNKVKIVTHHWSNNRLKGFDTYEFIDRFVKDNPEFSFTYIGRHLNTFDNTETIEPLFGKDLGNKLSQYDVYVSGTKYDPGPNHILESIACGIPTYTLQKGGGACEFSGSDHVFSTLQELKQILLKKDFKQNALKPYSWKMCAEKYSEVLRQCY